MDYAAGAQSMAFSVPEVNVSHLKRHVLANVGLLVAVLHSGDEEARRHSSALALPCRGSAPRTGSQFCGTGLMRQNGLAGRAQVVSISMVTQVTATPEGGLLRSIYSPLE